MNLIRAHVLRYFERLRGYVSSLPDHEAEVMAAMTGKEGVENAALIANFICQTLGHEPARGPNGRGANGSSMTKSSAMVRSTRKHLRVDPRYSEDAQC